MLTWNEFEEVLLDIELTLNNRPLIDLYRKRCATVGINTKHIDPWNQYC